MNSSTVLLIEDDIHVHSSLADVLQACGFSVISAHSADETISLLQSDISLDYVILDYAISGLDPGTLGPLVRNMYPDARIIVASGYSEETVRNESSFEYIDKFIAKPFSPVRLVEEIRLLGGC